MLGNLNNSNIVLPAGCIITSVEIFECVKIGKDIIVL